MILPTCKEVSLAFARDEFASASPFRRFRMRTHLLICRQCRRFRGQLELIEKALKTTVFGCPDGAPIEALQGAILARLKRQR
jgi:hypothetical protein